MNIFSATTAIYTNGIGFYSLGSSFSYICHCLADGLSQLGIPVISNIDYHEPLVSDFRFMPSDVNKIRNAAMIVVDPDQLDGQITTGSGIQRGLPFDRFVVFSMSDNVATLAPSADHPFFCTHENRFYRAPGFRVPWAFGCSSHMIGSL